MEDILAWLTTWYNVIYLAALAVATTFSLLQVFLGFLPDAIEIDTDGDGDIDIDVDVDGDSEIAEHATFVSNAMSFIGIGKAPASVLGLTFLILFGTLGLVSSALLKHTMIVPIPFLPYAVMMVSNAVFA